MTAGWWESHRSQFPRATPSVAVVAHPTQGPYRIEENVVEAGGRGHCPASEGAAPLLPQPEPLQESKQHQQH